MTRSWFLRIILTITCIGSTGSAAAIAVSTEAFSSQQSSLVASALDRFEAHGLSLPPVTFVFHVDTMPCQGRKGLYHHSTRTLQMCSMDEETMLHELAHAWANLHLDEVDREAFVVLRGLQSWNDHDDPWEERGTEHVAETVAWALSEESHHVEWVESAPDGSRAIEYRVLSLGADIDVMMENFRILTGQDPIFRHSGEWPEVQPAAEFSPEMARLGN